MSQFFEYDFQGRKPSKAQVMRVIGKALEESTANIEMMTITWGENWIQLLKLWNGQYQGSGWIKDISGSDIAEELNDIRAEAIQELKKARQFYNDHFQFIHIR